MTRIATDDSKLTLTERELASRLSWFINIRWFAAAVVFVLLLFSHNVFRIHFAHAPVLTALVVLLLYNAAVAVLTKALRGRGTLSRPSILVLANVQVVCDLLLLAIIWHYTGGVENPLGIFMIFPLIWASELMPRRNAFVHAVFGAALVNLVLWGEYGGLVPHVHLVREAAEDVFIRPTVYRDWLRVLLVAFGLSGAMFFSVYLAATVSDRLRYREDQLEQAFRGLKSVDVLKSRFMRKASHELRAPLAATHTLLRTVLAGLTGDVGARQRDLLQRATERLASLGDLINDLLRQSQLEAEAGLAVIHEPISLADVVRRTVELLSPSAEERHVALHTSIKPARVAADEEGLTELVTNLVSNAIRYSNEGGRVDVRLDVHGPKAVLRIEDRGIGIAEADTGHIFEEFFRSADAKRAVQHGTGMGLAIVRRLVEAYRGEITFESSSGRGTTFTVTLPLAPKAPARI